VLDSVEWDKKDHAICALFSRQYTLPPTGMCTTWEPRNISSDSFGMGEMVERLLGVQPAKWHATEAQLCCFHGT